MRIKIYRGTQEIGGTCIELTATNGKILWIDLGAPLDPTRPNVDYAKNKVDALIISHPHQDHYGLMESVGTEVPVYLGQVTLDLINATRLFRDIAPLNGNFCLMKPWKCFTIDGTFKVTPFLTDHSTPESFAFLVEADGKRVFYSGDFRATGRKGILYRKLIDNPPQDIDLLLIEGTMAEQAIAAYPTEESVEEGIYEVIKDQKNLSFVVSSAQNIDRFVSVCRACKRARKTLVIDIYSAWILEVLRKVSQNIPSIEWPEIKVYEHPGQLEKIKDPSFGDFRERIKRESVGRSVFRHPEEYVYFVRCPHPKLVDTLKKKEPVTVIYSEWEGYLEEEEYKCTLTNYLNTLKEDPAISFHSIHTSGHAALPDLLRFATALQAKTTVPIHTDKPETYKTALENAGITHIELWEDGKEYPL